MGESLHLDIKRLGCKNWLSVIHSSIIKGVCELLLPSTVEERIWMQFLTCFHLFLCCEREGGGGGGGGG